MAISCNPVSLVEAAKCFQCADGALGEAMSAALLCQWNPSGDCSQIADSNLVYDSYLPGSNYDVYVGQQGWIPIADISICRLTFRCTLEDGVNYKASVWTLSGNNLDAKQGESDSVTGTGSEDWISFPFSTAVNVSSGIQYALVFSREDGQEPSVSDNLAYGPGTISGNLASWNAVKARIASVNRTAAFIVYES